MHIKASFYAVKAFGMLEKGNRRISNDKKINLDSKLLKAMQNYKKLSKNENYSNSTMLWPVFDMMQSDRANRPRSPQ